MAVEILSPREIERMRRAGRCAAETLRAVGARLRAGVSTADIDRWVREDTAARGARPSQLGYKGFPASVCTSRNEVVCHGVPREDDRLAEGDIVNVDVTSELDGFHGDTSMTFLIGAVSAEARHVVDVARRCRDAGVAVVRGGARLGDIGAAIAELAAKEGCGVVYLGAPEEHRYQQGPGVAAATLMEAGVPVLAQRDFATLQRLIAALDPGFEPDPAAFDFVDHPWYRKYFADGPVGIKLGE